MFSSMLPPMGMGVKCTIFKAAYALYAPVKVLSGSQCLQCGTYRKGFVMRFLLALIVICGAVAAYVQSLPPDPANVAAAHRAAEGSPDSSPAAPDPRVTAYVMAKDFIGRELPGASFASFGDSTVTRNGRSWKVETWAESGGVRSSYTLHVKREGDEYQLVSMNRH